MDDLSFELAIALQLEDLAAITASRKGKGKAGDAISSNEAAFDDYREHLEKTVQLLRDERLAQSVDQAVRADADELSRITRDELKDESDRELAFKLSEDPLIKVANKDRKWRDMAVGSGIEVTDASIKKWEEKCSEWDVLGSQNSGGPSITASARKDMMKCASCMEVFPKSEILNATCEHTYCHVCMKQLFKNACKDEQLFPPRCCRQEIPLDVALPFLSNEDAGEFLDKTEEFTCEDRTYCFQPSCSKFISADNIIRGVGSCPNCYFATCTLCKKEYHSGDCPEDPSMKLTLETAAANGWQRCQKCHAIVELSHGCQHMTCRCKAQWCYRCGVEWKKCACSDWETGQLNRRAEDLAIREVGANANPLVLAGRVQEIRDDLQGQHECEHLSGWGYVQGRSRCDICSTFSLKHMYVCLVCRVRACNGCRMNRI